MPDRDEDSFQVVLSIGFPMRWLGQTNQKRLSPWLAALIFVAYLNCAFEHRLGLAVGQPLSIASIWSSSSPLEPIYPVPADDEGCDSGCICKGATLIAPYTLVVDSQYEWTFLIDELLSGACWQDVWQVDFGGDRFVCVCPPLPLRAAERCVWLQTLLI